MFSNKMINVCKTKRYLHISADMLLCLLKKKKNLRQSKVYTQHCEVAKNASRRLFNNLNKFLYKYQLKSQTRKKTKPNNN